jgi:hypothetical protein
MNEVLAALKSKTVEVQHLKNASAAMEAQHNLDVSNLRSNFESVMNEWRINREREILEAAAKLAAILVAEGVCMRARDGSIRPVSLPVVNQVLGGMVDLFAVKDDPGRMQRAAEYVQSHRFSSGM